MKLMKLIKTLFSFILILFLCHSVWARPVAVLPADKTATVGDALTIDGSSSFDEDNSLTLSYRWSLDINPPNFNSQINNPSSSSIEFTPDVEGFYLIRLVVNNGTKNSYPAYMVIRAMPSSGMSFN